MVVTRGELSRWWMTRETKEPQALFEAGDWRIDAVGNWLDAFLAGSAGVSVTWKDGGPFLESHH
jgi:hypothetical protein